MTVRGKEGNAGTNGSRTMVASMILIVVLAAALALAVSVLRGERE